MTIGEQEQHLDYSITEVANIIDMSRESVRRYIQTGMLKAVKNGKSYRIRKQDLYNFLKPEGNTSRTKADTKY